MLFVPVQKVTRDIVSSQWKEDLVPFLVKEGHFSSNLPVARRGAEEAKDCDHEGKVSNEHAASN
jgi:hypothetical protein